MGSRIGIIKNNPFSITTKPIAKSSNFYCEDERIYCENLVEISPIATEL
jgi:hypothetical protein